MKILCFWKSSINTEIIKKMINDRLDESLQVKTSFSISTIENNIFNYTPDVFFVHCHTENRQFDRIRQLTKMVRKKLPKCVIVVTYHPDINSGYKSYYLVDYEFDIMLPEFAFEEHDIDYITRTYRRNMLK